MIQYSDIRNSRVFVANSSFICGYTDCVVSLTIFRRKIQVLVGMGY